MRPFPQLLLALALLIPLPVSAQMFSDRPPPVPPASVPDVPSGPAMNLAPSSGPGAIPALPPTLTQPTIVQPSIAAVPPVVPPPGASTAGQAVLSLTARYGKDLPVINNGLVWRVFADKPDDTGTFKLLREERGATPNIVLPPGNYVVHDVAAMGHAVRREGRTGDDQAVGAHDPEEPHSKLVGARAVVAVQEDDLRDGVLELHRVKARTQPHDVPGMKRTHPSGAGLTSLHRQKPGAHEARKDAIRGHEAVLGTQALVGRGGEDCRCTGADGLEREPAIEGIGVGGERQIRGGVHDRILEWVLGGIARHGPIARRAAVKDQQTALGGEGVRPRP